MKDQGTRQKLVRTAQELFWQKGYEATSLGDIARVSKVNAGSLYYFFKTKEELLLAVLDQYLEDLWPAVIEKPFAKARDPIQRIFLILEVYRRLLVQTGCTKGCPIGNLALEAGDHNTRVRKKILANFAQWRGYIETCIEEAGSKNLRKKLNKREIAMFVLSIMEGAVMQTRAQKNLEPFDASVRQLQIYFKHLISKENSV
jgi:AcrR family transcriptional regulator